MNVFFFVSAKTCKNPTKNNVSLFKILYLSYLFRNIRIKEIALMVIISSLSHKLEQLHNLP